MTDDAELLRQYAIHGSESAFEELVRRHLPLVYSAALRQVDGDEALAKDVAQTVFIDLAKKAKSLLGRELLAGWLYAGTRLAASSARRGEHRRRVRERIAVAMQESITTPSLEPERAELKIVLDEAMSELDTEDRNAVLLRFFQGKELKEVGSALGISEDAARMRVNRSLGKLHGLLSRRGVALSVAALATALATEAVSAAPAGLAATIAGAALASTTAGAGVTLTLTKMLTMTKLKLGVISAIVAAGVATPLVVQHQSQVRLREENESLRQETGQVRQLLAENERLSNLVAQRTDARPVQSEQERELLRLRGEVTRLRAEAQALRQLRAAGDPKEEAVVQDALKAKDRETKLKQLMQDMPGRVIPEIYRLSDREVSDIAKDSDLDTEGGVRAAFSQLRFRAVNDFVVLMQPALKKYTDSHNGQAPEDVLQLAPYFDPPVDSSLLQRYAVVRSDPKQVRAGWDGGWTVAEKEPVDGFDTRWFISPVGFGPGHFDTPVPGKQN